MPLRVVCGPFQPSLEDAFVQRVSELSRASRRFAVVTPSRRMAQRLQRLLALEKGQALMGVRFHTFHSLALEIVEESGREHEQLVTDGLFHDKIIDRLLARRLKGRRLPRGLASAFRSSIRDLVDCGLTPEGFRESFGERISELRHADRLRQVLALQEDYLEALKKARILPPSGLARLAIDILGDSGEETRGRYSELLYYGFYDLTGSQADFFEAVRRNSSVTLFYPYRKGHPAFEFAKRFYEQNAGHAKPEHLESGVETRALGAALDAFGSPEKRAGLARPEALTVISASGAADEVWAAAKEILALVSGKGPAKPGHGEPGINFDDIGIVARTIEPYRSAVSAIFKENAVPFSMSSAEPLLRHPVAKLLLNVLQIERREFPVATIMDLAGSPYFKSDSYAGGPDKGVKVVGQWKALVARLGIQGSWRQWEGMLAPHIKQDFELFPKDAGRGKKGWIVTKEDTAGLWQLLKDLRSAASGPGRHSTSPTWKDMARHAAQVAEKLFEVHPRSPGYPAWVATLEASESLSTFDAACPGAGWEEFLDTLDERLRSTSLDAGPERGGVRVLDAMDARGESFKVLFLLGLQEGVFPRQVREDFLLRDETRLALDKDAGYLIRAKKGPGYEEERLLFYLLVSSASRRVYCVFQRSDETGRATTASDYLRKLCQACGTDLDSAKSRRIARQPVAKLQELEAVEPELLAPKELSLLAAIHQRDPRSLFKGLESYVPAFREASLFEAGVLAIEVLNSRGEPGAWDGLISTPAGLIAAWDKSGLSPSGLENFRKCPFRFFCARVLGLAEDDEPSRSGELVPALRGKLYHRILEKFHRSLIAAKVWDKAKGKPLDKAVWMPKLKDAIKEELPPDRWREFGVYPVLWEGLTKLMERHLEVLAEADMKDISATGLRPAHLEAPLEGTVHGVKFHGFADRVDSDGVSYRVVDYKSKLKKDGLKARVSSMAELQPPIYLELVKKTKSLDLGKAVAVSACFYGIEQQEDGEWQEAYDAALHETLGKRFFENIAVFKAMMDEGKFIITPDEGQGGPCGYCEFGGVCRKAHRLSRWRAENSRIFEALEKVREIPKPAKGAAA